jgi:hypothetical protein
MARSADVIGGGPLPQPATSGQADGQARTMYASMRSNAPTHTAPSKKSRISGVGKQTLARGHPGVPT